LDLIGLSYSEERANAYLWLVQSWTMHQCVLFPPGRAAYPHGPAELGGETIAVQERSAVEEQLFALPPPRPTLVTVATQTEALRLLRNRIATGVGGNSLTLRTAAAAAGTYNLVEMPLKAVPYGLMAKKGREADFGWVAPSMLRLREAGTVEALAEKFLAVPVPETGWRRYAVFGVSLVGALGAALVAVFAWNRSLRRKVGRRTRVLEATLRQKEELARSLATSEERYRTFLALSSEAIGRMELDEPLAVDRPEAEQVEHILQKARLAECNDALVRMLRHRDGERLVGLSLADLVATSESTAGLRAFLKGGYRLVERETVRARGDGTTGWVSVSALGIVENGFLKVIWLTQLEITARKHAEEALRASEKKHRDIFDFSPIGIVLSRPDGTLITANQAFASLLGYESVEDVLGLRMSSDVYFDPEERTRLIARYEGIGHAAKVEVQLKRRDGTPFWAELSSHAVKDAGGATLYFEAFVQDISARRAAEEELKASEERYRLLFEGNPLPMLVYELDTLGFLAVNEAAVSQYGYSREELLASSVPDLACLDDPELPEFLARRFDPRPVLVHLGLRRQRRKDGSVLEVDLTSLTIEFGGRAARLILARDFTAERRAEEERERLQESLRRSETMSAMGSLVAGVAHEVRNPLFGITATVDALESEMEGREQFTEYANLLRSQVARLAQLMHDLLEYGKPSVLRPAALHPREILRRASRSCAVLARERSVTLVEDVSPDVPRVEVDASRMEQVFQNLIANAIQHSPPGTSVRVVVRVAPGPEAPVEISVLDEGKGLAAADIPRLFEPFFSRRKGGTGLGLSLVQRIVEAHGGRVVAGNHAGGGAAFTVTLPVKNAEQAGATISRTASPSPFGTDPLA
jgi:PAS domain S-box-containing protein